MAHDRLLLVQLGGEHALSDARVVFNDKVSTIEI